MSQIIDRIRREYGQQDSLRDAGLSRPAGIESFDDIAYGSGRDQVLDIYRPGNARGKLPVIVSVHGGAWVYGDKNRYQYYTSSLADRGFAVVNFSYRLVPEYSFPASLEDTIRVFAWVREHAEEYGFDLDALFAVGDSAGAHLLGLYCAACTCRGAAARMGLYGRNPGPLPRGVALACGFYRPRMPAGEENPTEMEIFREMLPWPLDAESLARVDVLGYVTPDFPPTFAFTSTGDFLKAQTLELQEVLKAQGVPHIVRCYGDEEAPLGHVFQCSLRNPYARGCNDDQCAFFRSLMA